MTYCDGLDALSVGGFLHTADKRTSFRVEFLHTITEIGALTGLMTGDGAPSHSFPGDSQTQP